MSIEVRAPEHLAFPQNGELSGAERKSLGSSARKSISLSNIQTSSKEVDHSNLDALLSPRIDLNRTLSKNAAAAPQFHGPDPAINITEEEKPLLKKHKIPLYSWKRRFNASPPDESVHKPSLPPLLEGITMLPLAYRLASYIYTEKSNGRLPILDLQLPTLQPVRPGPEAGVPLGGIGCGGVGRGWKGSFRRWSLKPGSYQHTPVDADQFSVRICREGKTYAQVLSSLKKHQVSDALNSWKWRFPASHATYYGLFPRAWTIYEIPEMGVRLVCKQVSPVIPHNYTESSLPAAVFEWTVENLENTPIDVSIMFTFQNGTGGEHDKEPGHKNEAFGFGPNDTEVAGVKLSQKVKTVSSLPASQSDSSANRTVYEDPLIFAIAAPQSGSAAPGGTEVSYYARFETSGSGERAKDLWTRFVSSGHLGNVEAKAAAEKVVEERVPMGAALCQSLNVAPASSATVPFALTWDMPIVRFGGGKAYPRMYTRYFGATASASEALCQHALGTYQVWDEAIVKWQEETANVDGDVPDWYKTVLFNELYFLTDGGTIWTSTGGVNAESISTFDASLKGQSESPANSPKLSIPMIASSHSKTALPSTSSDPISYKQDKDTKPLDSTTIGHFLYLEGHEYLMYNTYDVHFYASFALIMNWPLLQLSLQRDFAAAVVQSDKEERLMLSHGGSRLRKISGQVPHDVGSPAEDPWNKVNAYNVQDVGNWKDLGPKFVLQVFRDYVATKDEAFLKDLYPVVKQVMGHCRQFDRDNDGMIENEGFPDQTYDIWTVEGVSAYTGGLWLAALSAASRMAQIVGDEASGEEFSSLCLKGSRVYEEKLWNGRYYNYDSSGSSSAKSIMADQLAGQWYARACGLPPIISEERASQALRTIFEHNVLRFGKGRMGAVNGMSPSGVIDGRCLQSREAWTGTTYALAATMIQEGRHETEEREKEELKDTKLAEGRKSELKVKTGMLASLGTSIQNFFSPRQSPALEKQQQGNERDAVIAGTTLKDKGFLTANGIYSFGWQKGGYWYATPEAWEVTGNYRSMGYMRALAVWSMQWAIEVVPRLKQK